MRESALVLAREKLLAAKHEVIEEKARLEEKSGLLKNLTTKARQERDLKTAQGNLVHYDSQLNKAGSLMALIEKDARRWLECCIKTGSPDYVAALATQDYPEDWARFHYQFELLVKSFQMGLQDLMAVFRREAVNGGRSQLLMDSVRKLLPVARQIEIDVDFFNRILVQQGKQRRGATGKVAQHPEYSWCETVEQLGVLPREEALGTLRELLAAGVAFLVNLGQVIKREQLAVESKAAQLGKKKGSGQSFLQTWHDGLRAASLQVVNADKLAGIITETESLLMDGEFTARFNRYMVQSITLSQPVPAPVKSATTHAAPASPQNDAEVRVLKAALQAELDEVAKTKAGFATRERLLKENEQRLRDQEQAFAEKCKREQAALDEAKARLAEMEAAIVIKDREAEEKRAEQMAQIEETKVELAARAEFLEESEQRLLNKGQEQLESLAELEQKEEELMATKRELNAMRKDMGIPMIPLRTKPVDEFSE